MVISNTVFFNNDKSKKFYSKNPPTGYFFFDLLINYFISLETLVCRSKYIKKISFEFNKNFSMISDLDLTLRLSQICKLSYCPHTLSKWRIHSSSDSWKKKDLFFLEKLHLIENLKIENLNLDYKKFLHYKKIFINKVKYSIILNQIEFGKKRKNLIEDLFKKKLELKYSLFLIFLIFFSFNRIIFKLYRKMFSITP